MSRQWHYLQLDGEYVIMDSAEGSDRVGFFGASFDTEAKAMQYIAQQRINAAADDPDSNDDSS